MKKSIFVSYDRVNDRRYRYLVTVFAKNRRLDVEFTDAAPEDIQGCGVDRIKAVLSGKIRAAAHTLVLIGRQANGPHPDRELIGERNWQWWEIGKSREERKGLIAVLIDPRNEVPDPLRGMSVSWVYNFEASSIVKAIENA